ncbi:O-antigen ligase family protein [Algimonas porphyrae]|nr:O-antigen ligase [Algimonas porphyrae]
MMSATYQTGYAHTQLQQRNYALFGLLRGAESALWVLIILFFSGAIIGLTFASAEALDQGDSPFARMLWYPIYAIVAGFMLLQLPKTLRLIARNPLIIICVLWLGLTFLWSIDPGVSLRRSIALMMTTLAGLVFAARYDWGEMLQRIGVAVLILCLITLVVALANPTRGIMQEIHPGAWRGPWAEKNYLGGIMAKGFAVSLCAFAMRPGRFWVWIPTGMLCFLIMLLSTSKTALLAAMGCFALFLIVRVFRRFPFLRVPVIWAVIVGTAGLVLLLTVGFEWALSLIGKDPTLTGRTDIWILLGRAIEQKFWLGYGYGVFWQDPLGPSYETRTVLQWDVPTAHNGWLDSWLSGGVVIIALFGSLLLATVIKSLTRIKTGGVETYWLVLSVFFFILFSLSESAILQQNDISWFLFVATTAKLWANDPAWWRRGSRGEKLGSVARVGIHRPSHNRYTLSL